MNKQTRTLLIIGVAALAAYLIYRYISNRGNENTGSGALGSNLNSVAPELIGGSSGPSQGPAVSVPVNITVSEQASENSNNPPLGNYQPANNQTDSAAISGMNQPVARANTTGKQGTPMRSTATSKSPMTAQHRAAAHPAVTGQAKANMAGSESGGTRPRVPSPSSHAAHHTAGKTDMTTKRESPTAKTATSTHANPTSKAPAKAPAKGRSDKAKVKK